MDGIEVSGSASHGSGYCYAYGYVNFSFFRECAENHSSENFPNEDFIILDDDTLLFEKSNFEDFNFTYESYFLDFNKYF